MDKEKQIKEMTVILCSSYKSDGSCMGCPDCIAKEEAKSIYDSGYRKASEVAREIFEEIDEILSNINDFEADSLELEPEERYGAEVACVDLGMKFAELKKKYTEE